MARTRLAVALLVPAPFDREIDGLRRALGDRRRERIPPHITLVPPINVRFDDVGDALGRVRAAAAQQVDRGPLELRLGPVATFSPASGVSFLAVGGADGMLERLRDLHEVAGRGPLRREEGRPFVPHVTVADRIEPARMQSIIEALGHYCVEVSIDRLHVLEHRHDGPGPRWVAVADMAFTEPTIVGRGGVELALTTSRLADPEALALLAANGVVAVATAGKPVGEGSADAGVAPDPPGDAGLRRDPGVPGAGVPAGAEPVVVTARRDGRVVGVAWGWYHRTLAGELDGVVVAPDTRGQGIGRQVRLHLEAHLSR